MGNCILQGSTLSKIPSNQNDSIPTTNHKCISVSRRSNKIRCRQPTICTDHNNVDSKTIVDSKTMVDCVPRLVSSQYSDQESKSLAKTKNSDTSFSNILNLPCRGSDKMFKYQTMSSCAKNTAAFFQTAEPNRLKMCDKIEIGTKSFCGTLRNLNPKGQFSSANEVTLHADKKEINPKQRRRWTTSALSHPTIGISVPTRIKTHCHNVSNKCHAMRSNNGNLVDGDSIEITQSISPWRFWLIARIHTLEKNENPTLISLKSFDADSCTYAQEQQHVNPKVSRSQWQAFLNRFPSSDIKI